MFFLIISVSFYSSGYHGAEAILVYRGISFPSCMCQEILFIIITKDISLTNASAQVSHRLILIFMWWTGN